MKGRLKWKEFSESDKSAVEGAELGRLEPTRRVLFDTPVYALSYSRAHPWLLAVAEEQGDLHIVDTGAETQEHNAAQLAKMEGMGYYHGLEPASFEKRRNPLLLPVRSAIAHLNSIFDLIWSDADSRLVTASSDRTCSVFDAERAEAFFAYRQHSASVKCVRELAPKVYASGARDGGLHVWDSRLRAGRAQAQVLQRGSERLGQSVTSVGALKEHYVLSAQDQSNLLKIWDTRKRGAPAELQNPAQRPRRGHTCVALSEQFLALSGIDHAIQVFRTSQLGRPALSLRGHKASYFVKCAISPSQRFLCSGSTSAALCLWSLRTGTLLHALSGAHHQELNCADWSRSPTRFLATSSDDCTVAIWGDRDD